jgi:acyl-CoA synthetase (AMP-forming)/AMP-acid ligase II
MQEVEFAPDEERFQALALELFAFQFEHCPAYARFARARGVEPAHVHSWHGIPAVPAGAFKELALRSFPEARERHVFRTSGTSGEARGALHLDSLELYEASLRASFERFVLPELEAGERICLRVLAASPDEAPDSSLSHMFGHMLALRGDAASGFDVRAGSLDSDGLTGALRDACARRAPVAVCGTAFAFVHLLDALGELGLVLELPAGSRIMETGGFKGRSREITRDELYASLRTRLGVPRDRIVNQYGMTELGSQFYDSVLRYPGQPRRKLLPPWARVRIVDPESGDEVAPGRVGCICIVDLSNTSSVLALQTADLGRTLEDGFEILGREPGAEARGCSLAADLMLSEAPA